ncbi:MAG: inositol monophosphatase family protein, partial [Halolamina sp.]
MKAIPETGTAWVVDPIDGTNNYVRELQTWATVVACVVDSEPVAAANALPALDTVYTADGEGAYRNGHSVEVTETTDSERATITPTIRWERNRRDEHTRACQAIVKRFGDLRRPGCAQCALANLAAGSVEGVITNGRTNPWDIVAGVHLVRQAGGTVTDLEGERWRHDDRGLDELLAVVRAIDSKPSLSRAR